MQHPRTTRQIQDDCKGLHLYLVFFDALFIIIRCGSCNKTSVVLLGDTYPDNNWQQRNIPAKEIFLVIQKLLNWTNCSLKNKQAFCALLEIFYSHWSSSMIEKVSLILHTMKICLTDLLLRYKIFTRTSQLLFCYFALNFYC